MRLRKEMLMPKDTVRPGIPEYRNTRSAFSYLCVKSKKFIKVICCVFQPVKIPHGMCKRKSKVKVIPLGKISL